MSAHLFACTKCMSRHPFEELSQGLQLCKDCRGSITLVKCTYCRIEFQESAKGSASVCKKCYSNVKLYGKPTACEYCNISAAFIGAKCQRCTNSEKRYGPPVTCEQCKQRCAFDRKDDSRKKVDGKLLCCFCTLSYKSAQAKTKSSSSSPRHSALSSSKSFDYHRPSSSSSSSQSHKRSASHSSKSDKKDHSPSKKPRLEISKSTNGILPTSESTLLDTGSKDHVFEIYQLKDQLAQLKRELQIKDKQMLSREKQAAEEKAQQVLLERELRLKIQTMQKQHGDIVEDLQSKVRVLQNQVITLSKADKKKAKTKTATEIMKINETEILYGFATDSDVLSDTLIMSKLIAMFLYNVLDNHLQVSMMK